MFYFVAVIVKFEFFSYLFVCPAGYVGCKSFLQEVHEVVKHLREANPNLIFGMFLSSWFSLQWRS